MKEITPMKRYKSAIDNLRSQVRNHSHEFTLNKADSKRIPWNYATGDRYETKGVESDFVMVFESTATKGFSFGLTFTYVDKEKDEQTVRGSVKFGDDLNQTRYGEDMGLELFQTSLKVLTKKLEAIENKTYDEIISVFSEIFLNKQFSIKDDIDVANAEVKVFIDEKKTILGIDEAESVLQRLRNEHNTAKATADKELHDSEAYQERVKLLERLARLDKLIGTRKVLIDKKEKVSEKKKAEKSAEETLQSKKMQLSRLINTKLMDYPKAVRNRIEH